MSESKRSTQPRNVYRVPARPWRRWDATARRVFNQVYHDLIGAWDLITPDSLHAAKPAARKVTAWNCAWIAADAARGE